MINKGGNVLVKRLGRIVHEGKLKTLKNLKADADKMVMGTECGIQVRTMPGFPPIFGCFPSPQVYLWCA